MPATTVQTASEKFAALHQEDWLKLEDILKTAKQSKKFQDEKLMRELPSVYRQVSSDLSEAKSRGISYNIIEYLNNLLTHSYGLLYKTSGRRGSIGQILSPRKLFSDFINHPWSIILALILFFASGLISGLSVYEKPEWGKALLGESTVEMFSSMYEKPIDENRSMDEIAQGTSFYITNNVSISFLCFAGGILFGLGSIFFLVYNGIFIGAIAGYICSMGENYAHNFWTFVTAHSVFELGGIVLCGATGLYLGSLLIRSGGLKGRIGALQEARSQLVRMVLSSALFVFFAAFIEAGISGQQTPIELRQAVLIGSATIFLLLFIVIPLILKSNPKKGGL